MSLLRFAPAHISISLKPLVISLTLTFVRLNHCRDSSFPWALFDRFYYCFRGIWSSLQGVIWTFSFQQVHPQGYFFHWWVFRFVWFYLRRCRVLSDTFRSIWLVLLPISWGWCPSQVLSVHWFLQWGYRVWWCQQFFQLIRYSIPFTVAGVWVFRFSFQDKLSSYSLLPVCLGVVRVVSQVPVYFRFLHWLCFSIFGFLLHNEFSYLLLLWVCCWVFRFIFHRNLSSPLHCSSLAWVLTQHGLEIHLFPWFKFLSFLSWIRTHSFWVSFVGIDLGLWLV